MKHTIIMLLIVLLLFVVIGCTSASYNGSNKKKEETKTTSESEECLDIVGISYYWYSGSMTGINYNYSILKGPTGTYLFHAELESGNRIIDKEISQKKFDTIMQMVNNNYVEEINDESADSGNEYVALDADSIAFEAIFADGKTKSINLGQANSTILLHLKELLEESTTQ